MATLQNIRSKGPLLVIVIGLALFAFIAGDAWKVLQPHQTHDVGERRRSFRSRVSEFGRRIYRSGETHAWGDRLE
mgnify:CR=1 FL=1